MKFITRKELTIGLQSCSIDEVSSFKDRIVDHAEDVAIGTVKAYLSSNYNMDYELRSFKDFNHTTIYADNDRIRVSNNADNHEFETFYGLELIDHNFYIIPSTSGAVPIDSFYTQFDPLEDLEQEDILVKRVNTCEPEKLKLPIKSLIYDIEKYKTVDNPNYDESCGIIVSSNGIYKSGEIINYYNTEYSTTGLVSTIDYSTINLVDVPNYQTLEYFDQYLLSNIVRDFTNDDRNPILMQLVIDITIYTLVQRVSPRQLPENIVKRYEDALEMLKSIQKGELTLGLRKYDASMEFQNNLNVFHGISKSGLNNSY